MNQSIQLDFFDEFFQDSPSELQILNTKIDNLRKGIFKRHGDLSKMFLEIQERQEKIESRLYLIEKLLKEMLEHDVSFDGELKLKYS